MTRAAGPDDGHLAAAPVIAPLRPEDAGEALTVQYAAYLASHPTCRDAASARR